jgi:DNA-binding NtrC family response regulator
LRRHEWRVSAAADALGVARATFYRRMKRYDIIPPDRADVARANRMGP